MSDKLKGKMATMDNAEEDHLGEPSKEYIDGSPMKKLVLILCAVTLGIAVIVSIIGGGLYALFSK